MLGAAPSAPDLHRTGAVGAILTPAVSAASFPTAVQTQNVAASGPLRASPYRNGSVQRAMPARGERDIANSGYPEPVSSADRERKPAMARMLEAFHIDSEVEKRGEIRFHGKQFDTDRQDPRMPGGNVDAAVKAFEVAAMRSAGLSLVSTLVSALVSGTRRLSQGS